MRTLPKIKSTKQKIIIAASWDYFGGSSQRANQVALYVMNRRRGVQLTEEEMSDVWAITQNISDEIYVSNLTI